MAFLDLIKRGAIEGWHKHKILPSLTGAQAILETGWGTSSLARPPYNNCFGIKADPSWTGRKVNMKTREWVNTGYVSIYADFRAYDDMNDSIRDHGEFFTANESRRIRYAKVIGETDYKKACYAVKNAGYATDPAYATSLIARIEQNKLYEWDKEAFNGNSGVKTNAPTDSTGKVVPTTERTVGGEMTSQAKNAVKFFKVSVIGDSLGVGTKPYLQGYIPNSNYDVKGSRQITFSGDTSYDGTVALQKMKDAGTLKDYVVVILGTNRGVTEQEVINFANICGASRKVLFVDTASQVGHAKSVSNIYRKLAIEHDNIFHCDWFTFASSKLSQLYYADGAGGTRIHMNAGGYKLHAEYIVQALYEISTYAVAPATVDRAVQKKPKVTNIENIELKEDGTLIYHPDAKNGLSSGGTQTKNIGIKGLYSPLGDSRIYAPKENESWGFDIVGKERQWIDGVFEDTSEGDPLKLFDKALQDLIKRKEPASQYTVKLAEVPDSLSIGDTGIFIDHEFNPPLYIEARVVGLKISKTNPNNNTVTISNVKELYVEPNRAIQKMQEELTNTRLELFKDHQEAYDIDATIETSNGSFISEAIPMTRLEVKLTRESGYVDPYWYEYTWNRISDNTEGDVIWNTNNDTFKTSIIEVSKGDIFGKQSSFVCTIKHPTGEILKTVAYVIKIAEQGKSAYQVAVDNGFVGTEQEWLTSLRGKDGEQGESIKGEDGKSSFLHVAYAYSPLGDGFSLTDAKDRLYIGTYVDDVEADSTDRTKYKWMLAKGEDGKTGQVGTNLLKSSNVKIDNSSNYMVKVYDLASDLKEGEQVTVTVKAKVPNGRRLSVYNSGGSLHLTHLDSQSDDTTIMSKTFNWKTSYVLNGATISVDNKSFHVYHTPNATPIPQCSIEWITLTRGDIPSIDWHPCAVETQESIDSKVPQIDYNNVLQIISEQVEKLQSLSTDMEITKNNALITHVDEVMTTIQKLVGDVNNIDLQAKLIEEVINQVSTYFKFDSALTIGKSDSKITIKIDNERMEFKDGETVMAWLSGNVFNAQNIKVNQALSWQSHEAKTENGLLVFRYIGG